MSTTLDNLTNSEFDMFFQAPYVTAGLNRKAAITTPAGLYRGFRLIPTGSGDRVLTVEADEVEDDHVAVYQTEDGYSLTVRRTGGDFQLDLSSYTSESVVIALFLDYTIGSQTTGEIRAYTIAEYDGATERDELVVLGEVAVPAASTPIVEADISRERVVPPSRRVADRAHPMVQVVQDPSFEISEIHDAVLTANAAPYWHYFSSANGEWLFSTTEAHSGLSCLELNVTSTMNEVDPAVRQQLGVTVNPGDVIRVRYRRKVLIVADTSFLRVQFRFRDLGAASTTLKEINIDASATDADFVTVEETVTVPKGASAVGVLEWVQIDCGVDGANYSSTGAAIRIDDFELWMERPGSAIQDNPQTMMAYLNRLLFGELGSESALMEYDPPSGGGRGLTLTRADKDATSADEINLDIDGQVRLGEALRQSDAKVDVARLLTQGSSPVTSKYLIAEFQDGQATEEFVRVYLSTQTYDLEVTHNAVWTESGGTWDFDDATSDATIWRLGVRKMEVWTHESADTNPWADGSWAHRVFATTYSDAGRGSISGDDTAFQVDNPTTDPAGSNRYTEEDSNAEAAEGGPGTRLGNPPAKNTLYAKSMPKAWGSIQVSSGNAVVDDGFNIQAITSDVATDDYVQVTFSTDMFDDNYAVMLGIYHLGAVQFVPVLDGTKTTSLFQIHFADIVNGGSYDITTESFEVHFTVFGAQS